MRTLFIIVVLTLLSARGEACSFDVDCATGSHCTKAPYALNGVCTGGLNQGNANDARPVNNFVNPTYGHSCVRDTDCGIGHCMKSGLYGTCVQ